MRYVPDSEYEEFEQAVAENKRLRAALKEIARRPTVERNPDGVDQAAESMRLLARSALVQEESE